MIVRSQHFDLGLDRTRIKDPRDAQRQTATVDALLGRFFHDSLEDRWELQILADEVGMGKTFVALGLAFSVLEAMQSGIAVDDLRRCYRKVLIITPSNSALFSKWRREVGEFVKRCVHPQHQATVSKWFTSIAVDRVDDLVAELRRPGSAPRVVIANTRIFGNSRLLHYDLKRRFVLKALFRYWGNRFNIEKRVNLLKGAPSGWPTQPSHLDDYSDSEWESLLFGEEEFLQALSDLEYDTKDVENCLETCREIAQPYRHRRDELFRDVEQQLTRIYRASLSYLVKSDLPLVIVDEAHNWKNGPTSGAHGYFGFTELIASRARRALLLTATPFQLKPAEMLELLKVSDHLKTCSSMKASQARRERLADHRDQTIRPVLEGASNASRRFAKAWSKLPADVTTHLLQQVWISKEFCEAKRLLQEVAAKRGAVQERELEQIIDVALKDIDPDLRQLFREALRLFVYNSDLSFELGALVVRHRRRTEHRLYRVGSEYDIESKAAHQRPDRHLLHAASGVDVRGEGELPHYLLMRCVSEMKGGKGRSSLGTALTGCYSTLVESAEGKAIKRQLADSDVGRTYLELLMSMVGSKKDSKHPKVGKVLDAVLENWRAGEKTLIFCFRTHSAKRLHELIDERIRKELDRRRKRCLGGGDSLRTLRTRLTGRERDLVTLGLDRVVWSLLWSEHFSGEANPSLKPDDLLLGDDELTDLAKLGHKYGVNLLAERIDRVFIHRATEHLVAKRLWKEKQLRPSLKRLLAEIRDEQWVANPYGIHSEDEAEDEGAEVTHFGEGGVHQVFERVEKVDRAAIERDADVFRERRQRARQRDQLSIFDVYALGPSLWLGKDPKSSLAESEKAARRARTLAELHEHLLRLTIDANEVDWKSRLMAMQAIRRAVFRESVLVRMLPTESELQEASWGELLVEAFFDKLPQQEESLADRMAVFLEDLTAASGSIADSTSARYALYDATRLRDQQFVALVSGETNHLARERIFAGFNTPLLPEVLICTSVGQEGIDLHRHCRHVVHFDLAWNPAVLEQRTGRADRIGSKTFRERARMSEGSEPSYLDIGVPYLAGTYDERMYEELRLRAQTFEVLTGGELASDDADGNDSGETAEGEESSLRFISLPEEMVNDMRVSLHVWDEGK